MIPTLKKLNKTAISLLEEVDLRPLYEVTVREGLQLFNGRYGTIYIAHKGTLDRVYTSIPASLQIPLKRNGYIYQAYKTTKIKFLRVEKITKIHPIIEDYNVKSAILIPLSYRKKCIGVVALESYREIISEQELRSLDLFGSMATLAIKQALLYQETQEAVQQRDLLISLTAHEFRTPLTTIHGYAQLLIRKIGTTNNTLKEYSTELFSETNRLINLTNGLLDMNRLKTGKMVYSFEECNISDILEKAVARFKFAFPKHSLIYLKTTKTNSSLIADFDKLLQVFTNLLDNAGKFTAPENNITITLHRSHNSWLITIADTGRGIIPDDLLRIFSGFYKGRNSDETQGMGLGLFIAKSIIDAHQGTIHVSSKIGVGTTFEIRLPLKSYKK